MPRLGLGSLRKHHSTASRYVESGGFGDDQLRTQLKIEHKKYPVYLLDVSEIVPGAQGAGRMAAARMCPSRRELARQRVANTFDEGSC